MARKRMVQTFREARQAGPYDEYPVLPDGVDPQLHLSRNDRQQPFFLTCEKDSMIVQMSGKAVIEFRNSAANYFRAVPGDYIYVPAGTAHRITPEGTAIQYRYKAENSGLEAVSFHCPNCGVELSKETWDTAVELPQEAYLRAVTAFNQDQAIRNCVACGSVHPVIDLADYRWKGIAEELRGSDEDEPW